MQIKKEFKKRLLLITFYIIGVVGVIDAQAIYTIKDSKDINMKLSGTSTLHKWEMNAQTFTGESQFVFKPEDSHQLIGIKSLTFSLVVKDLKSDEKALDKNAYKALKTDEYKDIFYKLRSARVVKQRENEYMLSTIGNLSIAGVTKSVTMDINCTINKDSTITCTGSDKLKMTDYKVKPPTFMLGAMKTGDDITLEYTLIYKK